MTHKFQCRVYYEDTDMGGIVYYANYLKFIERARSEEVRALDVDQHHLKDDLGIVFAVRRIEADYLKPAKLDDLLEVETTLLDLSGVRLIYQQDVKRGDDLLFAAKVTVVCIGNSGGPARFPADIRRKFEETLA